MGARQGRKERGLKWKRRRKEAALPDGFGRNKTGVFFSSLEARRFCD